MAQSKILRLVVDEELYQGFKAYCGARHRTMSEILREYVSKTVFDYEQSQPKQGYNAKATTSNSIIIK